MSSIVFVHGTGVREKSYRKTFAMIQKRVSRHAPGCNLVECLWGDEFGVKLHLSGKSIPNYTGKVSEDGNDKVLGWWTLYQDPYCELRSLAAEGGANQLAPPGRTPAWKQ